MIKLSRLNGSEFYLNPDLIEALEATPDTHVTLSNGQRYVVHESINTIRERIIAYNAMILRRSSLSSGHTLRTRRTKKLRPRLHKNKLIPHDQD